MPKGRAIDPIRVLRRYWKGIPLFAVIGGVIGLGAYFIFAKFYPLYTGELLFEVRPGVADVTDVGTSDISNDRAVERVQKTEIVRFRNRVVLEEAVTDRTMKQTTWLENFIDPVSGTLLVDDAVDELEEDIRTPIKPNTNLYGISWSGHVASDVPILLNAVATSYMDMVNEADNKIYRINEQLFDEEGENIKLTLQDLNDELQSFIRMKGITTLDDTRFSQDMVEIQQLTSTLTTTRTTLTTILFLAQVLALLVLHDQHPHAVS